MTMFKTIPQREFTPVTMAKVLALSLADGASAYSLTVSVAITAEEIVSYKDDIAWYSQK